MATAVPPNYNVRRYTAGYSAVLKIDSKKCARRGGTVAESDGVYICRLHAIGGGCDVAMTMGVESSAGTIRKIVILIQFPTRLFFESQKRS